MDQDQNPETGKGIVPERADVRQNANKLLIKAYLKQQTMTETAVKSKKEFQDKMTEIKKESQRKQVNPNHRVIPNLTPRGKDIMMRLNNKSLDTEGERSYTQNEEIVNARYMSKHELVAASKANAGKIEGLKNTLDKESKKAIYKPETKKEE